ncbi:hypothetical protein [Rhodococcoides corynebacterioides]|uniref:hypothetical protein n=1 Tax=Rhodococcoides corynebacterioides TaxID=53972 RepID=UPI0027DEF5E6|nr:hypothetical protein [Rhodococcus corynebacterioides]
MRAIYQFDAHDSAITGSATGKHETVVLADIAVREDDHGTEVTWRQTISKPMRLNLTFVVRIDGDRMSGDSRAGRLPRSEVSGVRDHQPSMEANAQRSQRNSN